MWESMCQLNFLIETQQQRFYKDTNYLSIVWSASDGMNYREAELSFGQVFAETFVLRILERKYKFYLDT